MASYGGGSADAQQKVNAPALAMLITVAVWLVLDLVLFFAAPAALGGLFKQLQDMQAKQGQPVQQAPDLKQGPLDYALLALQIGAGVVIILGSIKMRQLQAYPLAVTASILSLIPQVSPCCCFTLPFGIWALVVLMKPEVKSAFH
ncbi:MAG: hypothetical protein K2R98_11380 [Gemmataceae bacterium]|nr:hypothetical protein [Gemmataceae bacterium]